MNNYPKTKASAIQMNPCSDRQVSTEVSLLGRRITCPNVKELPAEFMVPSYSRPTLWAWPQSDHLLERIGKLDLKLDPCSVLLSTATSDGIGTMCTWNSSMQYDQLEPNVQWYELPNVMMVHYIDRHGIKYLVVLQRLVMYETEPRRHICPPCLTNSPSLQQTTYSGKHHYADKMLRGSFILFQ